MAIAIIVQKYGRRTHLYAVNLLNLKPGLASVGISDMSSNCFALDSKSMYFVCCNVQPKHFDLDSISFMGAVFMLQFFEVQQGKLSVILWNCHRIFSLFLLGKRCPHAPNI